MLQWNKGSGIGVLRVKSGMKGFDLGNHVLPSEIEIKIRDTVRIALTSQETMMENFVEGGRSAERRVWF